jgi:hypothetical protein
MVAVSNDYYTVSIDAPLDFENIEQRVQARYGARVYDICWDNSNERVMAYYTDQGEPLWFEIRHDTIDAYDITLCDVLTAFGCVSEDTVPILNSPLDSGFTILNYLVTSIAADFLAQITIISADDDPTPTSSDNESIDDDPTPTSSDNESIEEDNSDDPSYQQG